MNPFPLRLETPRLVLQVPREPDASALAAFAARNRAHHKPWEPTREEAYFTPGWWRAHLDGLTDDVRAGRALPFVGRLREDVKGAEDPRGAPVVLRANLSNVVRGVFQSATLGFAVDASHEGTGLAYEGVDAVVRFGFEGFSLHRIAANHRPENLRSERLLTRLGFDREGYAKDYLLIDGAWRDHVLTARRNEDWA